MKLARGGGHGRRDGREVEIRVAQLRDKPRAELHGVFMAVVRVLFGSEKGGRAGDGGAMLTTMGYVLAPATGGWQLGLPLEGAPVAGGGLARDGGGIRNKHVIQESTWVNKTSKDRCTVNLKRYFMRMVICVLVNIESGEGVEAISMLELVRYRASSRNRNKVSSSKHAV